MALVELIYGELVVRSCLKELGICLVYLNFGSFIFMFVVIVHIY